MPTEFRKVSPRALARLTGALYLFIMFEGIFNEAFVRSRLVVVGNAAATAHNIAANGLLWRWGLAADVVNTICDATIAGLLFILLRPVSRTISLSAAVFRLVYSAAMATIAVFLIAPLQLLGGITTQSVSNTSLISTLVMYSLRLHDAGLDIALVFFGAHLVLVGYLIIRSKFLPRWLGAALAVAGGCYAANSLIGFVAPTIASGLSPWILLPGLVSEAAFTLWLLIAGVNEQRWTAMSQAEGS